MIDLTLWSDTFL